MKPKILKISGLNSFKEEQIIDFTELTNRGLFGIFGPTGSGKSTILDAITIALYGEISRGTKEYINTDAGKLYVSFEFESGSGKDRKSYKVERSIKQKDDGGISTDFVKFYSVDNDGEDGVIDKVNEVKNEVTRIIGLTANDFTRSVVLPQGKFNEFLKLTGAERRDMLERVLGLSKYGTELAKKINTSRKAKEEELNVLNGELNRYDDVSKVKLEEFKTELSSVKSNGDELREEIKELDKKYEKYQKVWELQNELKEYLAKEIELKSKADDIKAKEEKLEKGKKANNVSPLITKFRGTKIELNKGENDLSELKKEMDILGSELSKLKIEYDKAFERKEKELNNLIEKQTNIKNAIDLDKEASNLSLEVDKNQMKLKELKEAFDKLKKRELFFNDEKARLVEIVNDKEKEIEKLSISSDFREKLGYGVELEKRKKELSLNIKDELSTINSYNLILQDQNKNLSDINTSLEKESMKFKEIEKEMESLISKEPKDQSFIISKQRDIEKLIGEKKEVIELEEKIANALKERKSITSNREELNNSLLILKEKLVLKMKEEELLKAEIKEIEKNQQAIILSNQLEEGAPCPVCGSKDHPQKASMDDDVSLEDKKELREAIIKKIRNLQNDINKLELEIKSFDKDISSLGEDIAKFKEKLESRDSKKLDNQINEEEKLVKQQINDLQTWTERINKNREDLDDAKEVINGLNNKKIALEEKIKSLNERLDEARDKMDNTKEELRVIDDKYNDVKVDLNVDNMIERMEKIQSNDKKVDRLEKELKEYRNKIKSLDNDKENIDSKINSINTELVQLESDTKGKLEQIENNKGKVFNICGKEDPKKYLSYVENLINEIRENEEVLREKKKSKENQLNKLQNDIIRLENNLENLNKQYTNLDGEIKSALVDNGFNSIKEAELWILEAKEIDSLDSTISDFKDQVRTIDNNISRINENLRDSSISEEGWKEIKENRANKKEIYNNIIEKMGQIKEKVVSMEKDLENVRELKSKVKKLQHTVDMLNDMSFLVRGNKFVEYVAINHLKYIAKEASKRLMEITNNRYALELDSKGNFIICDNYNGGVRRDCNTLSGGETFMTSLSLALALSTQIQLKGRTSLEFFFLDEGFGTLDNNLLEVVMSSLEKLYREDLCVGIISHVEELKNRVPVKLEVSPAEAGVHGTKVEIKYS
ncbi:AAA family ATPase [Sporosalibacterium faouarense]|uniref:AAA family ATPase n=1 Tax=Sporosalibacterium faouarense TaxID=516123 RepID=UPI00192C1914|nr:AAA family ATPase [Sporosalibacterium faouarense]